MCCRCASVSRTLVGVTVGALLSTREVQPLHKRTATASATPGATIDVSVEFRERRGRAELFVMSVRGQILPVPPATAQCLEQRRRIGIAAGLGLRETDPGLLIGLLGAEQRQVARV